MGKILCIETSTSVCSVAYTENGQVIARKELFQGNSHSSHLTVLIQSLFETDDMPGMDQLDAIAVSSGPGSYTGLRIGVSTAKGLCYALNVPLIAIQSLKILTQAAMFLPRLNKEEETLYCPMIDARRMEVYSALFNKHFDIIEETDARIIDEESFSSFLSSNKIMFFGDGSSKCKETIQHPNALFVDDIVPLAADMAHLAEEAYQQKNFEDVAYFEPFYLKDFVVTKSKKKLL